MLRWSRTPAAAAAVLFAVFLPSAQSENYPTKPITLIVPYAAGAAVDRASRSLGNELTKRLGQTVVVDNVPGGSGTLGARKALRAPPDGYTFIIGSINDLVIAPQVIKPGYTLREFTPIAKTGLDMTVLVAHPSFPASTADEFVKMARAAAQPIQVGVPGNATMLAFAASLLAEAGGFRIQPIVYKSGSPLVTDLLGNQVSIGTIALSSVLPMIRSGKLKALGVISTKRHSGAPEIPTVNEGQLLKGVQADLWLGLLAPGQLPSDIASRIGGAVKESMKDSAFQETELRAGFLIPEFEDSHAFAKFIKIEQERLNPMISNVKVE